MKSLHEVMLCDVVSPQGEMAYVHDGRLTIFCLKPSPLARSQRRKALLYVNFSCKLFV